VSWPGSDWAGGWVLAHISVPAASKSAGTQEADEGEEIMAKPIEVTDQTFNQIVLQAELPIVVDFWAVWCGPCKMIAPALEQIAEEYEDQIGVAKLDVDYNNETAMKYGVMSIPTLILFKNGEPMERIIGFLPKEKLVAKLQPHF
jgi:thioredoxin 1